MTAGEIGRTRFQDGMRVARVHLDHLQDVLLGAVGQGRAAAGLGKVVYGYRIGSGVGGIVTVGPGLAVDRQGRPLELGDPREVPVNGVGTTFLVLLHTLRSEGLVDGMPTLLFDDVSIEERASAPPYDDDAVVFARLEASDGGLRIFQLGEWYLPPLDHGHTGMFLLRQGRWRFDGVPLGPVAPAFDSGFVPVEPDGEVWLVHGLKSADLLVQLQGRGEDEVVTTRGLGQSFWYELVGDEEVRLARSGGPEAGPLELRVVMWPLSPNETGPQAPIADAGRDGEVDPGASFTLDGGRSRAFGGREIGTYVWTELS